ncbi:serine/threonine-protein kinase [Sphaerisporangium perillae]|uniref:serine/threonine-protein kinase n=1 Tax=Sphaerisporangium perillae TaxID=2935860 RepID=UPI00200F4837|nr:serine/threonine-protein kinase [Sphaerisporangium perillae]
MSNPVPLRPGDPARVGGYELTARLGEGGQGVVYLGRSPEGATVAVKVLRSDLAQNEEALARFVREVSTAERVATFCTAQVIETGVADQRPFIVSEYIDGPTLDAVVGQEGPRRGAALYRLAIGTVTALVAIHQAGIVHRDFKPSNVLLGADGPRVIDFGIAKALDKTSTLTSMVVGTPAYMTPEQLAGQQAGPAADMFAWAGTMVFAATGDAPFGTDSLPAVFHRIMNLEPHPAARAEARRGIGAPCRAREPAARPAAGEVLMRLLGHGGAAAAPAAAIMAEGSAVAQAAQDPGPRAPHHPDPHAPHHPAPQAAHHPAPQAARGADPRAPHEPGPRVSQEAASGARPPLSEPEEPTRRWRPEPAQGTGNPAGPQAPYAAQPAPGAPQPYAGRPYPGPAQSYPGDPVPNWQRPEGPPPPPWSGAPGATGPSGVEATSPSGAPPGGGRTGRVPLIVAGVVAVSLVLGGSGYLIAQSLGKDTGTGLTNDATNQQGRTDEPVTSSSGPLATPAGSPSPGTVASSAETPAAGATSAASPPPAATRTIKLPGSTITLHENDSDPIKLTFYSLDYGKRVYVRKYGGTSFAKTGKYFEYTVSDDGRKALGTDTVYTRDSYSTVSLVDRTGGKPTVIRIAKAPVYPTFPQWSPDGRKVLVTLNEAVDDTSKGYGYAIIDVAREKAKIVRVKEKDVGTWSYFWRGDGRAVGTWALKGATQRIRFYDLNGTVLQTLLDVGSPLTVEGDDVSPSGEHFMTKCSGSDTEICVWGLDGSEAARFSFPTDRLIGWYDDQHIAGWRKKGSGYEAVVVDLSGTATRVLATAKAGEYKKQYLRYTRAS